MEDATIKFFEALVAGPKERKAALDKEFAKETCPNSPDSGCNCPFHADQ